MEFPVRCMLILMAKMNFAQAPRAAVVRTVGRCVRRAPGCDKRTFDCVASYMCFGALWREVVHMPFHFFLEAVGCGGILCC